MVNFVSIFFNVREVICTVWICLGLWGFLVLDDAGDETEFFRVILFFQISSFRESRSDNRRFYIFTATKTLHLRTHSKKERVAWIRALVSTRCLYSLRPLNDNLSLVPSNLSLSTAKLKNCLLENGISEVLVKDCEQIMISEFSDIEGQVKVLCEERSNLLDTLRQLEVITCFKE